MEFLFKRTKLNLTVPLPFELCHVGSSLLGLTCLTTRQSFIIFCVVTGAQYWGSLLLAVLLITDLVTRISQAYGIWREAESVHTIMKCSELNMNLGFRWRWVVSFTPRLLFHWQTHGILGLYLVTLYVDTEICRTLPPPYSWSICRLLHMCIHYVYTLCVYISLAASLFQVSALSLDCRVDGGSRRFRNVGTYNSVCLMSCTSREELQSVRLWEPNTT